MLKMRQIVSCLTLLVFLGLGCQEIAGAAVQHDMAMIDTMRHVAQSIEETSAIFDVEAEADVDDISQETDVEEEEASVRRKKRNVTAYVKPELNTLVRGSCRVSDGVLYRPGGPSQAIADFRSLDLVDTQTLTHCPTTGGSCKSQTIGRTKSGELLIGRIDSVDEWSETGPNPYFQASIYASDVQSPLARPLVFLYAKASHDTLIRSIFC